MMALVLLGAGLFAPSSQAAMIVLESSGLLSGSQTVVTPFTVNGAGTLRVTLSDLAWPERFANLSFAFSDARTVLGRMDAPGVQSFTATGAGQFFAHVYGRGAGALEAGLYSVRVEFTPVPLPSAAVLLLAGFGLFAALRRPTWRQLLPGGTSHAGA